MSEEDDWKSLLEWLETLEDVQSVQQAFVELRAAGGDCKRAGWLEWQTVGTDIAQ